jgi:hypothetical protein
MERSKLCDIYLYSLQMHFFFPGNRRKLAEIDLKTTTHNVILLLAKIGAEFLVVLSSI